MSVTTEKNQSLENNFGRDSMDSPQGHMAEVNKVEEDISELVDGSASKNRVNSEFSLKVSSVSTHCSMFVTISALIVLPL